MFQSHLRVLFPAGLNAVMLPMLRKKYTFRIMQKATCTSATDPNSVLDADLLTPAFLKCSSAKKVSKRDGGKDTKSVRKRVTEMFYDNNNNSNNNHYCNSNNNHYCKSSDADRERRITHEDSTQQRCTTETRRDLLKTTPPDPRAPCKARPPKHTPCESTHRGR